MPEKLAPDILLTTFSIVARCDRTGMLGGAASTAIPGVGSLCLHVRAGAGAVATQSRVNPYLGIDALSLLGRGLSARDAVERVIAGDERRAVRQLGAVDARGGSSAYSGEECPAWFGHLVGDAYSIQGNTLVGGETLRAMAAAFDESAALDLPERLMRALEAGQAAGGDRRGRQSAALYVVSGEEYPYVDLRVDVSADPVAELRRVFEIAKRQLLPLIETLPTREEPAGRIDPKVTALLSKPPADR